MKLAIVAGGWHFPGHFYREISRAFPGADLFVIAHRSPELAIVREEKRAILETLGGPLGDVDRLLYRDYPTIDELMELGWQYELFANTVGDWGFLNQWLAWNDYRKYDAILNLHDDTYVRPPAAGRMGVAARIAMTTDLGEGWLLFGHGRYPEAPEGYVRGSLELWRPALISALGGHIDLGDVKLTREGLTDSPAGLEALSAWNDTAVPLRDFMRRAGWLEKIWYMSKHYRISEFFIEGERGLVSNRGGAPWSFEAGLAEWPL